MVGMVSGCETDVHFEMRASVLFEAGRAAAEGWDSCGPSDEENDAGVAGVDVVVVGGEEGDGYCEMVDGEECVGEAPCRNGLGSHRAKHSSV